MSLLVAAAPGMVFAASEQDIIDRIKPVGEVCIEGQPCPDKAAPAVVTASEPVAEPASDATTDETVVDTATAVAPAASGRSGVDVYNSSCAACHGTGLAGAPKPGDAAAWGPRLAAGNETVMKHAINGLNAMPPRGACSSCSDAEIQAAVDYMTEGLN